MEMSDLPTREEKIDAVRVCIGAFEAQLEVQETINRKRQEKNLPKQQFDPKTPIRARALRAILDELEAP